MRTRVILLALIVAAFALRAYRLEHQSLWTDEGFSVDFASQSVERMLGMWTLRQPVTPSVVVSGVAENELAAATDAHAPLYYFLLHYWVQLAGRVEFALRFLSVLFGLVIVALLYAVGRRLFDERVGLFAALYGAVSPFHVAYSQEARMYSLATMLSLLSVYLMVRISSRSCRTVHVLGYVVATALALYTHYFTALIVVFENAFILGLLCLRAAKDGANARPEAETGQRFSPGRLLMEWSLAQAGVLLLLAPWLGMIMQQALQHRNEALSVPPGAQVLYWYWQAINTGARSTPEAPAGQLLALLGVVAFLLVVRGLVDKPARQSLALLVLYVGIPLGATLAILQLRPMFHPRYIIAASPAYYLLLAASVWGLRNLNSLLPYVAGVPFAALLVASLNSYYFDPTLTKDDARGVAEFLARNASSDDLIVMDSVEPIGYYYRGEAPYVFLPGESTIAAQALSELAGERENVYHVQWWQSNSDPSGVVAYLLAKEGIKTEIQQFIGYKVEKYRMREGRKEFTLAQGAPEIDVNLDRLFQLKVAQYGAAYSGDNESRPALELRQGGKLWVVLRWELLQETDLEYRAFVNLKSSRGHVVGQSDRTLRKGQLPTQRWRGGDIGETYHIVSLLPGTPPDDYELEAGLYDTVTQRRISVLNRDLIPAGGSVSLGRVRVERASHGHLAGTQDVGLPSADPGIARLLEADLGAIRLVGYDLPGRTFKTGESLPLTLLWQAMEDVKDDYAFRLQAIGPEGQSFSWPLRRPNWDAYPTKGWIKGEFVRDWHDLLIPQRFAAGKYQLRGIVVRLPEGVEVGAVDLGAIEIEERRRDSKIGEATNHLTVRFGDHIELVGFDLRPQTARAGDVLELTLYWRALREMDESYTVFAHLLDGGNRIWGQHDSLPAGGEMPTTSWLEGEIVLDRHPLPIKSDALPDGHTLEVGIYDAASGKRLPAGSSDVKLMGDAALIADIEVRR